MSRDSEQCATEASVAHCSLSRVRRHLPAQAVPPTDAATRLLGVLCEATALSHSSVTLSPPRDAGGSQESRTSSLLH